MEEKIKNKKIKSPSLPWRKAARGGWFQISRAKKSNAAIPHWEADDLQRSDSTNHHGDTCAKPTSRETQYPLYTCHHSGPTILRHVSLSPHPSPSILSLSLASSPNSTKTPHKSQIPNSKSSSAAELISHATQHFLCVSRENHTELKVRENIKTHRRTKRVSACHGNYCVTITPLLSFLKTQSYFLFENCKLKQIEYILRENGRK